MPWVEKGVKKQNREGPKPGLWRASIAIRDLSRLTAGRRPEVEARLFARLHEV